MAVSFITFFPTVFSFYLVCFVCFYLILYIMYSYCYVLFRSGILFHCVVLCVLSLCKCALYCCHRASTQLQSTDISHHIPLFYATPVEPHRENSILFNSISFHIFHTCWQHCKERLGTSPSRTNRKARSPVTHTATVNQSKLQKTVVR